MRIRKAVPAVSLVLFVFASGPAVAKETVRTRLVSKILGSTRPWDERAGVRVQNDGFKGVLGTDLGAVTFYKGRLWFNIGDTQFGKPGFDAPDMRNFLVAYSYDTNLEDGIEMDGYLNGTDKPGVALDPRPAYPIPNAMFTVKWRGQEHMFAQYMEVAEVSGHDHHVHRSRIAKYDADKETFVPYKPELYTWTGKGAPKKHFHFGMASFWVDYEGGRLYALGSPSGRFGGVKLARTPLDCFLDAADKRAWEYYLGDGKWSAPTTDQGVINSAAWLVEPKDPDWSLAKNYDDLPWPDQGPLITIAEFCVVHNRYLDRFLLITGRPCSADSGGGVWYHTAPAITGPWSAEKLLMKNSNAGGVNWSYYGTYTTDALLRSGGRNMYFVATTWEPYGIYLYEAEFTRATP